MRHLERSENGRPMKALVARGLAPLAQTSIKLNFCACPDAWVACCRTLPKSKLLGFAGWCG